MLNYYSKRYEVISQGNYPANRKKIMLTTLMNEMESHFNIPMHSNATWEQENKEVSALYRQVAADKKLLR